MKLLFILLLILMGCTGLNKDASKGIDFSCKHFTLSDRVKVRDDLNVELQPKGHVICGVRCKGDPAVYVQGCAVL